MPRRPATKRGRRSPYSPHALRLKARQEGGGNGCRLTLLEAISLVPESYALEFRGGQTDARCRSGAGHRRHGGPR
jgi:hypothetical protein